ncbi:hypothetical protein U9M48_025204 [Paspalum notatum var. saurae]|uniref:Uncharacterized protein n=1 Tax=Paspalum notatum var. saurae TaxID=547442 RepID=A0AAQ3WWY9_PASNO
MDRGAWQEKYACWAPRVDLECMGSIDARNVAILPLIFSSAAGQIRTYILKSCPTPDMDELERAAPGEEPIHRPFRRLLAVLVPVDGDDDGAVPCNRLVLAAVRRGHGEWRGEHLKWCSSPIPVSFPMQ